MLNVVFTGPAFGVDGQSIIRRNLVAACEGTGVIRVMQSVGTTTDLLVASRKDTSKARNALKNDLPVMTYSEFILQYLVGVSIPDVGTPDKYTDAAKPTGPVPDYTSGLNDGDLL